jgi:CDP-6-deoxy-D-xylo-4-hexulose-3-dehydrase
MNEVRKRLPLASSSWGDEEIAAIQRVIKSGFYSMGDEVREFEKEFAEYVGSKYCVMCSSGSTANLIMTAALFYRKENPLVKGNEIVVPAVSWSTTYFPLSQYGLNLKFVDIDLETLNYDLDSLQKAIGPDTKAIMAVNLLGNPNDFVALKKISADRPDIILIEDNCESLGAKFDSKNCGTFGVMGTFSFFFSHHMSTMEGGAVVTDNEELYHILLCLRAHGWTRNLPKHNHVSGVKSDNAFEESFKFFLPGYNVRPLEMSGAIGREQVKKLPGFIEQRRANAAHFQTLFKDHPDLIIQKEIGQSSWFGFSFVIRPESKLCRQSVIAKLEEALIDCRPIVAGNFARNRVLSHFEHSIFGELKNADIIDSNGFFVGNHHFPFVEPLDFLSKVLGAK